MNQINDICIENYKPDDETIECTAINCPYNSDLTFPHKKMAEFNRGCLPPHSLMLKPGCIVMLLRNMKLTEGIT